MPRFIAAQLLISAAALSACSPALNWREVRVEPTPLKAMLPCKPDKGMRQVPLAGRQVELRALGCDATGATFAILHADIGDASRLGESLEQWKSATLLNLRGESAEERPFLPPGSLGLPQSLHVAAQGRRPDGSQVQSQAVYFARGTQVFQAVIYSSELRADVTDAFFGGLKFE